MNIITASDLQSLVAVNADHCVSIYMPTHASGREGQQDAVRLKNLVTAAEEDLVKMGMPARKLTSSWLLYLSYHGTLNGCGGRVGWRFFAPTTD